MLVVQDADVADRIDRSVRDVLSRPPYAEEPNPLDRLVQWVLDRLGDVGLSDGVLGVLAWVVRGLVWAVVVAVVVVVLWLVLRRVGLGAFRRAGRDDGPTTSVGSVDRSAADWLARARAAEDRGDHREAVRAAYRAVVVHLVALEAVPAMAGATVGDHRSALRHSDVVAVMEAHGFDAASDVFERVWYADEPAGADDARTVLAAADDLGIGR